MADGSRHGALTGVVARNGGIVKADAAFVGVDIRFVTGNLLGISCSPSCANQAEESNNDKDGDEKGEEKLGAPAGKSAGGP